MTQRQPRNSLFELDPAQPVQQPHQLCPLTGMYQAMDEMPDVDIVRELIGNTVVMLGCKASQITAVGNSIGCTIADQI
jgi:hypothetical protein